MAAPAAELQLDRRRGTGEKGRRVLVLSNLFAINKLPDFNVMHYDVAISPEVPPRVNRQIYDQMRKQGLFGDVAAVYDGRKNIYAPKQLPFPGTSAKSEIFLADSDRAPRPGQEPRGRTFNVTIRLVAQVNLHELGLFINNDRNAATLTSNVLMAINALNVMIRNDPSLVFASKGSSFYPPPKPDEKPYLISGGLEMWAGYFTSIRPAPGKMIVNLDRTAMPMIMSGDLVRVCVAYMRMRDPNDLTRAMDRSRVQLERFLKGLQISTRSLQGADGKSTQKKKYKIRAVSNVPASQLTFEGDQGQKWTIVSYFQSQYNYTLRFPSLPCVQVTKKAWYPMEVCEVERGNKFTKKLNPDQVAEALKFTTQPPNRRLQLVREGLGYLGLGRSETLRSWQFQMQQQPMQVKARVLDPPKLGLADGRSPQIVQVIPRDGAWDLRQKRFTKSGKVERWMVLVFANEVGAGPRDMGAPLAMIRDSITQFVQACSQMGIEFRERQPKIFHVGDTMDVRNAFLRCAGEAGLKPPNAPQLVVTYVPMKNSRQYALIKTVGDLGLGVATQNMVLQKVRSARPSYYQNVALKVNVKLAGVNQIIQGGLVPGFNETPTLVLGADVGHPSPGSMSPSVAAVVASHDLQALQYSTQIRVQNNREEIITDLEGMAIPLIKKFFKMTKRKPERVIMYRDGVSEGQFAEVCRQEVRALKRAFTSIQPDYNPPITYIVCGKRHHVRFFPNTQEGGDRSGNVRAGTVVDMDVVSPVDNDFYLMSHGGLLGTSRPCHYSIILDQNRFKPDDIQALTYALAYIYPRSTRSVSIPSPAYYAHHVATRGRAYIGADGDDDSTTMVSSASSGREDAMRDQKLGAARSALKQIHVNLESTMYFM